MIKMGKELASPCTQIYAKIPESEFSHILYNKYDAFLSVEVCTIPIHIKTSEYQYILVHLKLWEELAGC